MLSVSEGMSDDGADDWPSATSPGGRRGDVGMRRRSGAAVVHDPDAPGPGVITERDVLEAVAAGLDPDAESVAGHLTANLTFARGDWSLEHAAATMVSGGFRHLVVVEGSEVVGILARCATSSGCGPARAPAGDVPTAAG